MKINVNHIARLNTGFDVELPVLDKGRVIPGVYALPSKEKAIRETVSGLSYNSLLYHDYSVAEIGVSPAPGCHAYLQDALRHCIKMALEKGCIISAGAGPMESDDPVAYKSGCNPTRNIDGVECEAINPELFEKILREHGVLCGAHIHMTVSNKLCNEKTIMAFRHGVFPLYRAIVAKFDDPFEVIREQSFFPYAHRTRYADTSNSGILEWKDMSANLIRSPVIFATIVGAMRAIYSACCTKGTDFVLNNLPTQKDVESCKTKTDWRTLALDILRKVTIERDNSPYCGARENRFGLATERCAAGVARNEGTVLISGKSSTRVLVRGDYDYLPPEVEWQIKEEKSIHGFGMAKNFAFRNITPNARLETVSEYGSIVTSKPRKINEYIEYAEKNPLV